MYLHIQCIGSTDWLAGWLDGTELFDSLLGNRGAGGRYWVVSGGMKRDDDKVVISLEKGKRERKVISFFLSCYFADQSVSQSVLLFTRKDCCIPILMLKQAPKYVSHSKVPDMFLIPNPQICFPSGKSILTSKIAPTGKKSLVDICGTDDLSVVDIVSKRE